MSSDIRVRFAPSPTGTLHVGGARTAIYNWAFARKMGGTFILRIDDTDPERSTTENTEQILRSLNWLGIDWDEGPVVGGDSGPYFQTQRAANYTKALETMIANGDAYPCFCSSELLAQKREASREKGGFSGYDRTCRSIDAATAQARIDAGEPHVWRLKVPDGHGPVLVDDIVRGETVFPIEAMDDFVLARGDRTPTYNFASVVDDGDMAISHVIRGDDHLANTPRQILVFEALGYKIPRFAHLSMIWGADGKKLSKRHGATSVEAWADLGYLPESLLNYLALLGWSLDGETTIVSAKTLCEHFSLERISKNPAIFDVAKLEWMNGVYIRELGARDFALRMIPLLEAEGLSSADDFVEREDWFCELAPLVSERIKLMTEIVDMIRFLFVDKVEIDEKSQAKVLDKEGAQESLVAAHAALASCHWHPVDIEAALHVLPEQLGLKNKIVFQSIRVAVTGTMVSPPLWESLALLGREKTLERLEACITN